MIIPFSPPRFEYPDFVDALRHNRVRQSFGTAAPDWPLDAQQRSRDWALPSYDFGTLIEHIALNRNDVASRLVDRAAELAEEGRLRAPYDECVYILRHIPDRRMPLGGVSFYRISHNGSEVVSEGF